MRASGLAFLGVFFPAAFAALLLSLSPGCATKKGLSGETKARIESWWILYLKNDPGWPQAMEKWLALGRRGRLCLMDNLLLDIRRCAFRTRKTAEGDIEAGWLKPAREFCKVGGEATAYLIEALKQLKEEPVIDACVYILSREARFDDIAPLLDDPGAGDVFLSALARVLAGIRDPRSVGTLAGILSGPYGWRVRASAAQSLGACGFFDRDRAREALEKGENDADPLVSRMAREALEKLGGGEKAPAPVPEGRGEKKGYPSGDGR